MKLNNPKITPKQVKTLRHKHDFTLESIAAACGVSPRTVEGWEQGRPIRKGSRIILRKIIAD